ncbi:MAG: hypothetical protein HY815_25905 [Candidatus Riflebacteria bacterium]|nr:hypothetical protein [Candidatus Riflebacteria bacterium]
MVRMSLRAAIPHPPRPIAGGLIVALLLLHGSPSFATDPRPPDTRYACFKAQRTLEAAVHMWTEEKKPAPWPESVHAVTRADQAQMVKDGHLTSIVEDPVSVPPSAETYVWVAGDPKLGGKLLCLVHGRFGSNETARAQLEAAGVRDETVLRRALAGPPPPIHNPSRTHVLVWLLVVAVVLRAWSEPGRAARLIAHLAWGMLATATILNFVPSMRGPWVPVSPQAFTGVGLAGLGYLFPGDDWGVVSCVGWASFFLLPLAALAEAIQSLWLWLARPRCPTQR